jgi:hypothetical protein
MTFTLDEVVPWGRNFDEYAAMNCGALGTDPRASRHTGRLGHHKFLVRHPSSTQRTRSLNELTPWTR